jgi:hypothetical protein
LSTDCTELTTVVADTDSPDVCLDFLGSNEIAIVYLQVSVLAVFGSVVLSSAGVAGDVKDGEVGVNRYSILQNRKVLFSNTVNTFQQVFAFESHSAHVVFSLHTREPVAACEKCKFPESFQSFEFLQIGIALF